jgi:hypothetical protein
MSVGRELSAQRDAALLAGAQVHRRAPIFVHSARSGRAGWFTSAVDSMCVRMSFHHSSRALAARAAGRIERQARVPDPFGCDTLARRRHGARRTRAMAVSTSAGMSASNSWRASRRAWLRELPELTFGAELALHVRGDCMHPLIVSGARVRVRRARVYWPGDVLAVLDASAGVVKLHRCVGYRRRAGTWCVLTQPDASPVGDPPIPVADVLGRVSGGECAASVVSVPWKTRAAASSVFLARALRWLGDRTRLLPQRSTRGA